MLHIFWWKNLLSRRQIFCMCVCQEHSSLELRFLLRSRSLGLCRNREAHHHPALNKAMLKFWMAPGKMHVWVNVELSRFWLWSVIKKYRIYMSLFSFLAVIPDQQTSCQWFQTMLWRVKNQTALYHSNRLDKTTLLGQVRRRVTLDAPLKTSFGQALASLSSQVN